MTPGQDFTPRNAGIADFLRLWQSKRRGDALPARADFPMEDLRPFLGRIGILDVVDAGADFRFRLYGSNVASAYKAEMTGKSVTEFRPNFQAAIVPGYRRCFETRQPHYDLLEIDDPIMLYKWERIVVPLSSDGRRVDMLMVYSSDLIYQDRS